MRGSLILCNTSGGIRKIYSYSRGSLKILQNLKNFQRSPPCKNDTSLKDQLVESGHRKTKENIIPRGKFCPLENDPKGHFPLGGIFRAERHFLLFKDQLAESECQKTKENIIPRGKFQPVENDPKDQLAESGCQKTKDNIVPRGKFRLVENGPKAIFHLVEFSARSDIFYC